MRSRHARLLIGLFAAITPSAAAAQGLPLNRYYAAEAPEDGFVVARPVDRGHDRWGAQVHLSYAANPLVYEAMLGDAGTETQPVVEHQLTLHAGLSLGLFDRLIVYAGLPIHLVMAGEAAPGVPGPDEPTIADPWLGARFRIYGEEDEILSVGAQATLTLPLADGVLDAQSYSGETSVSFVPKLLAEVRPGPVRFTANLGLRIRDEHDYAGILVRNELLWAVGVGVRPIEGDNTLDVLVEMYGAHALDYFGRRETTSIEGILGVKYLAKSGFTTGLAVGPGISRGWGTPDVRVALMLGFVEPVAEPEPEPAGPADRDEDGIEDRDDECADEPEDLDENEDEDGCPDLDDDHDEVPDASDECADDPEDRDGHQDDDGCPDPDNDADGMLDGDDGCPNEAEDRDGFDDENGCPDLDNDGDGVLDPDDECPTAPGPVEARGCPRFVRIEVDVIRILERIEFDTNRTTLRAGAERILDEIRAVLEVNPRIRRLRVEGHTDDRGPDPRNLRLSQGRAAAVLGWLTEHGIAAERLEGYGCGEARPIQPGTTTEARQANRRVEFHIIEPAHGEPRSTEGCLEMTAAPAAAAAATPAPARAPARAPAPAPAPAP